MPTNPLNTSASVSNAAESTILSGNSGRTSVTIVNIGSNDVDISKGVAAVLGKGIRLVAGGGTHQFSCNKDGVIFRGDIHAISSGGVSTVTICEEYNQP